jgi:hypothetical protein
MASAIHALTPACHRKACHAVNARGRPLRKSSNVQAAVAQGHQSVSYALRLKRYNTAPSRFRAGEARQGNAATFATDKRLCTEELIMKTYSKPTLTKHAALKQITFSSH